MSTEWTSWEDRLPPLHEEVEWRRSFDDTKPFIAAWAHFHPLFNVFGLSWRPLSAKLQELGLVP